nr:PREDICTED: mast cell tryptase-like [Paralichthys olivaceus]
MALQQFVCGLTVTVLLLSTGCQSEFVCGLAPRNLKISGGREASPGNWPWLVSIAENRTNICGGSLINDQWILTAAHCMSESGKGLTIYLGSQRQSVSDPNEVSRTIAEIKCHPSYEELTNDNDICLLKLSSPVTFNSFVYPVCLPTANSTFYSELSSWVAGWGSTRPNEWRPSDTLQEVNLPIVGNNQCRCKQRFLITDNMICAGGNKEGNDTCRGDSGGALVNKFGGRWVQSGIVSFGDGCAKPDTPGVYVRVSQYQEWIKSITSNNQTGFVLFKSPGVDKDANSTCSTSAPLIATTKIPHHTRPRTFKPSTTEDDKSIFGVGVNLKPFTHLLSLCVLALSLHALVGHA